MKTKTQQRFLAITAWVLLVCTLTFASCDNGGGTGTGHTHSYSTTWSFNATQHWKECIANDGAKTGTANHTSNLCTVCGYDSLQNWTAVADNTIWQYIYNGVTYTNFIYAIAYGNNKFVAVGQSGKMAYSSNGITWTAVADSTIWNYTYNNTTYQADIYAIAYGNNRFVAVGERGKMAYSDDGGESWTAVADSTFSIVEDVSHVAYGNGRFVAANPSARMAYSDDGGESWTAVADSTLTSVFDGFADITDIAYGIADGASVGRFVAVGYDAKMAYSDDGTSWTRVAENTFGMSEINGIAYGNGKWVAVGYNGRMAYSDDGTSWTRVSDSTFGTLNIIRAIAYGNGRFVAVGVSGKMAYSTDGTNWTAVVDRTIWDYQVENIGTIQAEINGIAYGNNRFVAVSGQFGKMAYANW